MNEKNIIISDYPVSVLAKDENGYYTSNSIFDGIECISSRFDLKPSEGRIIRFFGFSISDRQKLIYMSLRVEDKTNDHRNSKHCDLYYISCNTKPRYNKTVPYLIKAICRKTSSFCTNAVDLIEAMLYIRDYIPDILLERIVLSFDDASDSENVILLSDSRDNISVAEKYYRHFARYPHLYSERFKYNIDTLYSKGYYKDGPSDSLIEAVTVKDKELKEKQFAERLRIKEEEEHKKALLETERKRKELEESIRREEERLKRERLAREEEDRKRLNAIRALSKNEAIVTEKADAEVQSGNEDILFDAYPYSSSYIRNPLHVHSLISYYSGIKDRIRARDAWKLCSLEQIVEYFEQIKHGKEKLILYAEPDPGSNRYLLYKALKDYLLDNKENSGLFISLLFWFNRAELSEFTVYGIDYGSSLNLFSRTVLYREYTEHDSLPVKIGKFFQHCSIDRRIHKMVRRSKRRLRKKG